MGVILDSSILIAVERRQDSYRARTDADRKRREAFVEELFRTVVVHPLTLEVAR